VEACVSKYHRLHSTSCSTEPAAIVDHFAGSGARRLHFGWKHKKDEWIVIRCQSVWTCFSLRKWFFQPHGVTFFGLLGLRPQTPPGLCPDPLQVPPPNQNPGSAPGFGLSVCQSFFRSQDYCNK